MPELRDQPIHAAPVCAALTRKEFQTDALPDFLVYCVVARAGGEPLRLVWRLRQRDGRYRIIDLMVEGVSLVQTQRQEFVSFIRANGGSVDKLIAELRQRTI